MNMILMNSEPDVEKKKRILPLEKKSNLLFLFENIQIELCRTLKSKTIHLLKTKNIFSDGNSRF